MVKRRRTIYRKGNRRLRTIKPRGMKKMRIPRGKVQEKTISVQGPKGKIRGRRDLQVFEVRKPFTYKGRKYRVGQDIGH